MKCREKQATDPQKLKKMSMVVFSFFVSGSGSDRCGSGSGSGRKITASTSLVCRLDFKNYVKVNVKFKQISKCFGNEATLVESGYLVIQKFFNKDADVKPLPPFLLSTYLFFVHCNQINFLCMLISAKIK